MAAQEDVQLDEKLAEKVRKFPCLFDKSSKDYKDKFANFFSIQVSFFFFFSERKHKQSYVKHVLLQKAPCLYEVMAGNSTLPSNALNLSVNKA